MKQNDNRLEILRFQGGYLYDKGENDELFHFVELAQRIYKYIITLLGIKVNGFRKIFIKNIFCNKRNIFCENLLQIVEKNF